MRKFQILDINGNPVLITDLDKEVCEITGNEVNKEWYCPLGRKEDYDSVLRFTIECPNWYDSIGWLIADKKMTLKGVLEYLAEGMSEFLGKVDESGNIITLETIYPYHCKVINYWIEKGYTAISLD